MDYLTADEVAEIVSAWKDSDFGAKPVLYKGRKLGAVEAPKISCRVPGIFEVEWPLTSLN